MDAHTTHHEMVDSAIAQLGVEVDPETLAALYSSSSDNIKRQYLTILTQARDRISKPGHWYQGDFGPDPAEWVDDDHSLEDIPFCALGTISWACGDDGFSLSGTAMEVVSIINRSCFYAEGDDADSTDFIMNFNDCNSTTQDDVVELFDKAIKAATTLPLDVLVGAEDWVDPEDWKE